MKSWKIAVAALLGFSTACSSVKNAPKNDKENDALEQGQVNPNDEQRIMAMYGVPNPDGKLVVPLEESQAAGQSAEQPADENK